MEDVLQETEEVGKWRRRVGKGRCVREMEAVWVKWKVGWNTKTMKDSPLRLRRNVRERPSPTALQQYQQPKSIKRVTGQLERTGRVGLALSHEEAAVRCRAVVQVIHDDWRSKKREERLGGPARAKKAEEPPRGRLESLVILRSVNFGGKIKTSARKRREENSMMGEIPRGREEPWAKYFSQDCREGDA